MVLESDPLGKFTKEAADLRQRAAVAKKTLVASGEGGYVPFEEQDDEKDEEEDAFDALVPLFYR